MCKIISLMSYKEIVKQLGLVEHVEGGFFREIYRSPLKKDNRSLMTTIYYMVCSHSAVDRWHMNKSDIVHFHHKGGAIQYYVIYPEDGRIESYVLGSNLEKGELLQLVVPGGTWKACHLLEGDYGLLSQGVAPGFEYEDMTMGKAQDLLSQFPQHQKTISLIQKIRTTSQHAKQHGSN